MPAPTDNTLAIIAAIMVLAGIFIGGIFALSLRRRRAPAIHQSNKPGDWIIATAGVVIVGAFVYWSSQRDARMDSVMREQETTRTTQAAGYLHPALARLTVDLNACPPRTDGMTDQVVMSITTRADDKPVVTGCTRIAERSFGLSK